MDQSVRGDWKLYRLCSFDDLHLRLGGDVPELTLALPG